MFSPIRVAVVKLKFMRDPSAAPQGTSHHNNLSRTFVQIAFWLFSEPGGDPASLGAPATGEFRTSGR
jgi:hypothetical protein